MTILAQHGFGKGNKISRGLRDGAIRGAIMSPRDDSPDNLASYLRDVRQNHPEAEMLVDPQFHIGAIPGLTRTRHLSKYPHYRNRLNASSFTARTTPAFVAATLEWQNSLDVSAVLSPTVMVDDLNDQWAQVALTLAQESIYQHRDESRPLLISLVVEEDALRQRSQVDDWLDDLTALDADGFYIVVRRRDDTYQQNYESTILSSLMRVCHSLAEINEFRVFVGYTDIAGLLLHAVGIEGTGTGWYGNLRQFTLRRFEETSGGRTPLTRYSSSLLLNSIYVYELSAIYSSGLATEVLSPTLYDRFNDTTDPITIGWPLEESTLHHWSVLNAIVDSVPTGSLGDRLDSVHDSIVQALATYAQVSQAHRFSPDTGSQHLLQWQEALRTFRLDLGA